MRKCFDGLDAHAIGPFTSAFTAEFEAMPMAKGVDGLIGLSKGPGATFTDFAMLVRFNNNGRIDVRNGGTFAAKIGVSYIAGVQYHFRVVADVATRKYDVYVKAGSSPEIQLAAGYAFRTEQQAITSVDNWAAYVDGGGMDVCNFTAKAATTSNQLPTAKATATPTTGAAPLAVQFDGSGSSDPDGLIASYAWNFGDGTTGTGAKVSHTYSAAGTYSARLTVTDNKGATASAAVSITSGSANQPPKAVAVASATSGIAPLAVNLDASGSTDADGTIAATPGTSATAPPAPGPRSATPTTRSERTLPRSPSPITRPQRLRPR